MKKNNMGFTLVELLAVIVILGLLMAIAIPSVTKYIVDSRKKTLISSIDSYISAVVTQVNDGGFNFSDSNKIYAVPIECISLEKGGTNPFGNWMQANENYWAYVLVHYDSDNYNYEYGFTFKDDAGYGLYPTNKKGQDFSVDNIKTDLDLSRPINGVLTSITSFDIWNESGFKISSTTSFHVLEAESEGIDGDGEDTCTLQQKGDNYEQVIQEESIHYRPLAKLVKKNNDIITKSPNLMLSSDASSEDSGLYVSNLTNNKNETYYFRGNVTNNYVKFANLNWRIIRVNEDGSVRLILNGRVFNKSYQYNSTSDSYNKMYYSNSTVESVLNDWYETYIFNNGYDDYVSLASFCEQAKVKMYSNYLSGSANMIVSNNYNPDFRCEVDGNGKGIINSKIGLITYDELIYAGAHYNMDNANSYLYNGSYAIWTMSPTGFLDNASVWLLSKNGRISVNSVSNKYNLRPVINLKADALASGTGTSSDPYVVKIN